MCKLIPNTAGYFENSCGSCLPYRRLVSRSNSGCGGHEGESLCLGKSRPCACRWANGQGQDFLANHQVAGIDFATFHSWVDNWLDDDPGFQLNWINQHAADAATIGKPVEFSPLEIQRMKAADACHAAAHVRRPLAKSSRRYSAVWIAQDPAYVVLASFL